MSPCFPSRRSAFAFYPHQAAAGATCFLVLLLTLLLSLSGAKAGDPDSDYMGIYIVMHNADVLSAGGRTTEAMAKYIEAQRELTAFQEANPNWNNQLVNFRLQYLADKIAGPSSSDANAIASTVPASTTMVANAPASNSAANTAGSMPTNSPALTPAPSVKLLDAGGEPRMVLRLHPKVGDKQTMTVTAKIGMNIPSAGNGMPAMNIPAVTTTMTCEVKEVSTNGDISYDLVIGDATVMTDTNTQPNLADAMKGALAGLHGITGNGKISASGINLGIQFAVPDGANPQLSQAIDQMKQTFSSYTAIFPEAAVGTGAKWEYANQLTAQGMTMDQTATFELVSVNGDQTTLHSTLQQSAPNQKIQNPAMPGVDVSLLKLEGSGVGNATFDLSHVLPSAATMDENSSVVMNMSVGQQQQTMNMNMTMDIAIESKPATP